MKSARSVVITVLIASAAVIVVAAVLASHALSVQIDQGNQDLAADTLVFAALALVVAIVAAGAAILAARYAKPVFDEYLKEATPPEVELELIPHDPG